MAKKIADSYNQGNELPCKMKISLEVYDHICFNLHWKRTKIIGLISNG